MKILITGGTGRLGKELKKLYSDAYFPTRQELDITKPIKPIKANLVIHCAGYTDVAGAQTPLGSHKCMETNYLGTKNMVDAFKDIPFVYISSEYVTHFTDNVSALSKWMGECEVQRCRSFLIIRTAFKPRPYPYDRAFVDQWTMGDYVDVIAKKIKEEIDNWDFEVSNLVYVGTEIKTIYDLAVQTRPDVAKASVDVITQVKLPKEL